MKKLVFTGLAALLMLAGLNSCNDNKVEFAITSFDAYITAVDDNYTLYATMSTNYGELQAATITANALPLTYTRTTKNGNYGYFEAYETGSSISSFNGSYRYSATSVDGAEDSYSVSISTSSNDEPGTVVYDKFSYDGTYFRLNIPDEIANTDFYGLYFDTDPTSPFSGSKLFRASKYESLTNDTFVIGFNDQDVLFSANNTIRVYPATFNEKNGLAIIKYSASDYKTLTKGGKSFNEDAE